MWIEPRRSARRLGYEGETYYFCSQHCLETFRAGAERTRTRHRTEVRILHALHNGIMRTVAQPIVSLPDRSLVGVEALARFNDPADGSPTGWLEDARSVAMQTELEFTVVANAIDAACGHIGGNVPVHINLSPDSILSTRFEELLRRAGTWPSCWRSRSMTPSLTMGQCAPHSRLCVRRGECSP